MAGRLIDDPMRSALAIGAVALVGLAICASVVVWQNRQSRTLALAGGALLAAVVLLATQLLYELQPPWAPQRDLVDVEYTIDRQTPSIRSWKYSSGLIVTRNPAAASRFGKELAASAS